jgi:predicted amidohydrolase
MWNCPYSNESFPRYAEDIEGDMSPSVAALMEAARKYNVLIVGGSVPERSGDHLFNTCCVVDTDGQLLGKHRCATLAYISAGQVQALNASDAKHLASLQFARNSTILNKINN